LTVKGFNSGFRLGWSSLAVFRFQDLKKQHIKKIIKNLSFNAGLGLGSAQHGIRAAKTRVLAQVSDSMFVLLPKQTRIRPQLHRGQVNTTLLVNNVKKIKKYLVLIEC
jgi:hypothetical protein